MSATSREEACEGPPATWTLWAKTTRSGAKSSPATSACRGTIGGAATSFRNNNFFRGESQQTLRFSLHAYLSGASLSASSALTVGKQADLRKGQYM